ncbi:hypothetical protein KAFR_0A05650 [Kazachstania africana CBS 2517]|uniref:Mitochondrial intermembrane space import and assembly protein 40 n=1 Tax=Kazachstania africana (strain ATCC 22294 / BCRC 22015 / CBS 2517 / CECT 1963 / NBRC 1671 / NRRL Y-8276) TaxID=1071382 RepID=H2ANQ0_KAZAF|nr:hypothetical protein KAFR_0A05650 [Kazachstania africana CBS 2517]CCF56000.1 hypothetical protein KAFR_0A05650 [Kazachstania africana CBS 2517]
MYSRQLIPRNISMLLRSRTTLPRLAQASPVLKRYNSSSSSSGPRYNKPLAWTLGAAAMLTGIYLVAPFDLLPKRPKVTEQIAIEPKGENPQAQTKDIDTEVTEENKNLGDNIEATSLPSEVPIEKKEASTDKKETTIEAGKLQVLENMELGETEEEVRKEGAYNPETGEINWDCPCLGGMAYGPCGEEFKEAFSCFIYSEADPKGIDCVEKFQHMQDCFRKYPEHYAEQLKEEEEATAVLEAESKGANEDFLDVKE